MSEIKIATLYSGSRGNSTYIRMADTAILIDAGRSAKRLCAALKEIGSDIEEIRAIFITHDHTDHTSALETLCSRYGIPIHMTDRSASIYDSKPMSSVHKRLCRHGTVFEVEIGGIRVKSFPTPHDSLMSVGYRVEEISNSQGRTVVGLATDIGYVTEDILTGLVGCDAVVVESNHDLDMLRNGSYPDHLKRRILSNRGHLSNNDCAKLCKYLASMGTRAFLLAHLSEENNLPSLAMSQIQAEIADGEISLAVADPCCPTELPLPMIGEG